MDDRSPNQAGTEATTRAASLLLLFLSGESAWGVSGIAREMGLAKSVVHRMLQSFVAHGFLVRSPETRKYSLGPAVAALGAAALRSSDLRLAARPGLARLRAATGETVTLCALIDTQRVFIDQLETTHEMKITVALGRQYPLTAGATGRVLLAYLPESKRERILATEPTKLTDQTIPTAEALRDDCERIRELGYAISQGERQSGAASVAAPVFDLDGEVVGAITVCGPTSRLSRERLDDLSAPLTTVTREVSARLGHRTA
ncbi:IclR family transcriptional regulator [Leucobacter sp. wl10]|uniref:IclR family transcriptional regulator n=1 Tax=Leucobacter sp. wl10 TaxID=2304677 RepID=UPI000E5A2197|nr:IclR family transcriptional regulator [Leucobacter sp. wl10]RGE16303.1 IclR family transcriptional regulator [Leucobacter sp. wl10]